uniref:Uncharacterized protein n=1 Tax=Arundo donax TaxID=35708 RepID=A0A0A8ZQL7_ARUDO
MEAISSIHKLLKAAEKLSGLKAAANCCLIYVFMHSRGTCSAQPSALSTDPHEELRIAITCIALAFAFHIGG